MSDGVRATFQAMYTLYTVQRTQIYLTEKQGRVLKARSRATGQTISEIIRAAIDDAYVRNRPMSVEERMRVARQTAGAWTDFAERGADYVGRIRGGGRLRRSR